MGPEDFFGSMEATKDSGLFLVTAVHQYYYKVFRFVLIQIVNTQPAPWLLEVFGSSSSEAAKPDHEVWFLVVMLCRTSLHHHMFGGSCSIC